MVLGNAMEQFEVQILVDDGGLQNLKNLFWKITIFRKKQN